MKILFVDDSKSVHFFLKDCFRETPHELHSVYDGEQALDAMAKSKDNPFDLVFLDWEMPGLTGPDVLQELKNREDKTPVVMLTSKNSLEDIQKVMALGAVEYIMKPFNQDLIFEKVEGALGFDLRGA